MKKGKKEDWRLQILCTQISQIITRKKYPDNPIPIIKKIAKKDTLLRNTKTHGF